MLVIGGSNVDIMGTPVDRLVPEDSNPGKVTISAGGVGRNVAENIARLGILVKLLSAVGADHFGEYLKSVCREAGIDTGEIISFRENPTSAYLCIMERNRDMYIAVNDMKIMERIGPVEIQSRRGLLSEAEMVIIDNNLTPDTIEAVKSAGCKRILFDAVSGKKLQKTKEKIYGIDTVKLNALEAGILSGIRVNSRETAFGASEIIMRRDIKNVFITLGSDGAVYSTAEGRWHAPPAGLPVRNTTGAGDAFLAGIACGFHNKLGGQELLDYGTACAAAAAASEMTVAEDLTPERIREILNGENNENKH